MRAFGRQHYDITARVERRSKRDGGEVLDSSEVELIQSSWDVEEYLCQLLRPMSASAGKTLVPRPAGGARPGGGARPPRPPPPSLEPRGGTTRHHSLLVCGAGMHVMRVHAGVHGF
jgi:hypothetical protein